VFEDSPQDPKMTWMNISSDEGLTAVPRNILTCYTITVNESVTIDSSIIVKSVH